MKNYSTILLIFASLAIPPGLLAKFVLPGKLDTSEFYRGITHISCSGENCIATEIIYSPRSSDSNVIITSNDGGVTWYSVVEGLPQWKYDSTHGRRHFYYYAAQQIDSLNAIIADDQLGELIITHDGWKTWHADSSLQVGIHGIFFSNAAQGMLQEPFGFYWSTIDSGNHWKRVHFNDGASNGIACQSYGDGVFRVFSYPGSIFTTYDNWQTWDTAKIAVNGPLADTSFHPYTLFFSASDSMVIEGWKWDTLSRNHASVALALSTNFGLNWEQLAVPSNNGIYFTSPDPSYFDWRHMVVAGKDSVGRIVQSFDAGAHWECDTVPLSSGSSYHSVPCYAVTGSGRLLAAVTEDNGFLGSTSLAYLQKITSSVATQSNDDSMMLFPNPAFWMLNLPDDKRAVVHDIIGREYRCEQSGNRLDVSTLPSGIYYVNSATYHSRFIKE